MARSSAANEHFPAVSIRRAAVADAAEIARLSEQFGHPVAIAELPARIAKLDEMPSQHLVVAAVSGGKLLGWIQVEHRLVLAAGERAEIVGLVVDAAARRRGVGTLLAMPRSNGRALRSLSRLSCVQMWCAMLPMYFIWRSDTSEPRPSISTSSLCLTHVRAGAKPCQGNPSFRARLPNGAGCCRPSRYGSTGSAGDGSADRAAPASSWCCCASAR